MITARDVNLPMPKSHDRVSTVKRKSGKKQMVKWLFYVCVLSM